MKSDLSYSYAMHPQHELALDDILFSAYTLCVFHNGLPRGIVNIDEVGDVLAGLFQTMRIGFLFGVVSHSMYCAGMSVKGTCSRKSEIRPARSMIFSSSAR